MLTLLMGLLAAANPLPVIDRPVVDSAGVLSATDVKVLSDRLRAHHDGGGAQIAVVVMPRASATIEETALALAERWAGGRAGVDDGALVLLLTEQRRVRVEVGYGLEGVLPDARVLGILDDAAPALSQQRWAEGLGVIVDALVKKTGPGAAQGRPLVRLASRAPGPFAGLAAFLVVYNLLGFALAVLLLVDAGPSRWPAACCCSRRRWAPAPTASSRRWARWPRCRRLASRAGRCG